MISKRLISGILVMLMVLSAIPILIGSSVGNEGSSRWGNPATGVITERSLSQNFEGYLVAGADNYATFDATGDGIDDSVFVARNKFGEDFLGVVNLTNGATYWTYNLTYRFDDWEISDFDKDGKTEVLLIEDPAVEGEAVILQPQTKSVKLTTGKINVISEWIIIGNQLVLFVQNVTHPDYTLKILTYNLTNYSNSLTTPEYPNPNWDYYYDLDDDGEEEIIVVATWDLAITVARLYVIDTGAHAVVLNSTDLYDFGYDYSQAYGYYNVEDLNNDGHYELIAYTSSMLNNTAKVIVYSSLTWKSVWSNSTMEFISGIKYGDLTGDSTEDLVIITWSPSSTSNKIFLLSGTNGALLARNSLGAVADVWAYAEDVTGDGICDVFLITHIGTSATYRMYKGSASVTLAYNLTLPLSSIMVMNGGSDPNEYVGDLNGDGKAELLLFREAKPGSNFIGNFTVFTLAGFNEYYKVEGLDEGTSNLNIWFNVFSINNVPRFVRVNLNHLDPANKDYSQAWFYDIGQKKAVITTPPAKGELFHYAYITWDTFDSDGTMDFYWLIRWQDTGEAHSNATLCIINGSTFTNVTSIRLPENDVLGYTLKAVIVGGRAGLYISIESRTSGKNLYNYSIYDAKDFSMALIYRALDKNIHYIYTGDFTGDGKNDIVDYTILSISGILDFYGVGSIGPAYWVHTAYYPTMDLNFILFSKPSKDGYVSILTCDSSYDHLGVYNTQDWSVRTEMFTDDGKLYYHPFTSSFDFDINSDTRSEWIVTMGDPDPAVNEARMYVIDQDTGYALWDSGKTTYKIWNVFDRDIEKDKKVEVIIVRTTQDKSGVPYFQIQTNNVVTNMKPKLTTPIANIVMDEDTVNTAINAGTSFTDDGTMTFTATSINTNITVSIDAVSKVLNITPDANWSGNGTVNLTAFDGFWEVSAVFTVTVNPINDVPMITTVNDLTPLNGTMDLVADQEVANTFDVNATDADSTDVLNYTLVDATGLDAAINDTTGIVTYTPVAADGPLVKLTVNVTDTNSTNATILLNISIANVPHTPFNVTIAEPLDDAVLEASVNLTGSADDLDLPWGDALNFTWTSDIDGVLGYGTAVNGVNLTYGPHNITLTATDSTDRNATATVTVFWNVTNGPVKKNPEWWFTLADDKADLGDLWIKFKACQVNTTTETDKPSAGKTTMTTVYTFSGTCKTNITVIHMYWGMQADNDTFTLYPFYDPGSTTYAKLEITPEGGTWSWTGTSKLEFDTPVPADDDVINTTDDDVTPAPVYTTWYGAVGWDEWGNYAIDHQKVGVVEPADDDVVDDDVTGPSLTITSPKTNAEFAPGATITVSGTSTDLPTGTNVTVTLDGLNATAKTGADGKWSTTIKAPSTEGTFSLSAQAPGALTMSVNIVVKIGATSDDDVADDDTGYSSGLVYGLSAGLAFAVLLVIILIIVVIVVSSKKKKGEAAPEPAKKEEGAPAPPPEGEKAETAPPAPEGEKAAEPSGPAAPAPPEEAEPEAAKPTEEEEEFEEPKGDKDEKDDWELDEDGDKPPAPPPEEAEFEMDDDEEFEIKG